jgi:hypothetical protein
MRLLLLPLRLFAMPLHALVIGAEDFADADNSGIAGKTGGTSFHYDSFDKGQTAFTSEWDNVTNAPTVVAGKLVTANSGAKREYTGTVEGTGNGTAQLFVKVEANP